MNRKLKAKIIEHFGSQFGFAQVIEEHETIVSRVVRGHRSLSNDQKRHWAKELKCAVDEIFPEQGK